MSESPLTCSEGSQSVEPQDDESLDLINTTKPQNWLRQIWSSYPKSFIGMMMMLNFNEGLMITRTFALKDLYKNYYHSQPSVSQAYTSMIMLPSMFKIVSGLIVDAKLVK